MCSVVRILVPHVDEQYRFPRKRPALIQADSAFVADIVFVAEFEKYEMNIEYLYENAN